MKKDPVRSFSWVVLVTMPLWFSSCRKEGSAVIAPNSLAGTWTFSGLKISPALDLDGSGTKTNDMLAALATLNGANVTTCFTTSTLTFTDDGKLTSVAGQKCDASTDPLDLGSDDSTWWLDGTKMMISTNIDDEMYDILLNENSLYLSQTDDTTDYDGDGENDTVTITIELTR